MFIGTVIIKHALIKIFTELQPEAHVGSSTDKFKPILNNLPMNQYANIFLMTDTPYKRLFHDSSLHTHSGLTALNSMLIFDEEGKPKYPEKKTLKCV
jgi:hypothetical protein